MSLNISLEPQEVQVVMGALAKLPLENSIDLWFKVRTQAEQQLSAQQQAQQPPAPPADGAGAPPADA